MAWSANGFVAAKAADRDGYVRERVADRRTKGQSRLKLSDDEIEGQRTTLPTAPCFHCGDRGWCAHRDPYA